MAQSPMHEILKSPFGSTRHFPKVFRTLSGKKVPLKEKRRNTGWVFLPLDHEPTVGAHRDPNHPSRKHDVERPDRAYLEVEGHYSGPLRRRDRRWIARFQEKVVA